MERIPEYQPHFACVRLAAFDMQVAVCPHKGRRLTMQREIGKREGKGPDGENPLGDEGAWNEGLGAGLKNNPEVAQEVALLLSLIKDSVELGSVGAGRVGVVLDSAIHLMFPYTETCRTARELWMLSLRGVLEWRNEPDQLLKAAIEQGNRELERVRAQELGTERG
jgi:hypothetical protein